ncbi:MAG: VWA domain-containing protein [Ardenticatenales bacterium]
MSAAWRLVFADASAGLAACAAAIAILALARRAAAGWRAMALRGAITLLIATAIADPRLVPTMSGDVIAVLDTSSSLAPEALATVWPSGTPNASARLSFGDRSASPLGAAIDLAVRALPDGGRVLVASDGAATDGDRASRSAAAAVARGVSIDAVALAPRPGPDAAVIGIRAPNTWHDGDIGQVEVSVAASTELSATVRLTLDERTVGERRITTGPRPVTVAFNPNVPPGNGPWRLQASIAAPGDREPGNDRRAWVVQRAPTLNVLVVGDSPEAIGLADVLTAAGITTAVLGPTRLGGRLSALARWDACVVVDLPASAFGVDQLATFEAMVTEHGQGLVLTGGRQSFLQGGWRGTALARLSPLLLAAPPQGDREAVALLLMVDRSASMAGGDVATHLTKLDLAREAAVLAAEVLQPGDTLGILAYDTEAAWVLPLTVVGEGARRVDVDSALRSLTAGGGTLIESALAIGLPALAAARAPTRHAVLLSDGRDASESTAALEAAVGAARAAGVTFSTLGIGRDADPELLGRLAQIGRGRAYVAVEAGDLPRLTVEESEIVRARAERSGSFRAQRVDDGPASLLSGVDVGALPPLSGYLALRPRPDADVALESPTGDPLLSGWQVGLGRVAAWASDVGAEWASAWPGDASARNLWLRAVRWTARSRAASALDANAQTDDATGRTVVTVQAMDDDGAPLDLAAATLVITSTEGASTADLRSVGPGLYAGVVTLQRIGAWPAAVRVAKGDVVRTSALTVARGFAPELAPGAHADARLAAIAAAGGGAVIDAVSARGSAAHDRAPLVLWPWLVALAAALWPLDVALQVNARQGTGRQRFGKGRGPSIAPDELGA